MKMVSDEICAGELRANSSQYRRPVHRPVEGSAGEAVLKVELKYSYLRSADSWWQNPQWGGRQRLGSLVGGRGHA